MYRNRIYSLFMTPRHGVLILKNGLVDSFVRHFLELRRFLAKVRFKTRRSKTGMDDQTVKQIIPRNGEINLG